MLHSMWDLSSPVRNQIHAPCKCGVLITGLPGNYLSFICLLLIYFWICTLSLVQSLSRVQLNLFINLPSLRLWAFCSGRKPFSSAHSCACAVSTLFPVPHCPSLHFLLCVPISRSNVILQGIAQTWSFPASLWIKISYTFWLSITFYLHVSFLAFCLVLSTYLNIIKFQ